ncbi:MAG TPA: putative lipid II flippase FtsW [Acidimicrobiales bacterium]|nr:putative lipid II flippase FtsW [Acidimicrobiales bacterium]
MTTTTPLEFFRRRQAAPARERSKPRREYTPSFVALGWIIVGLNLLGVVMVLSASSVAALDEFGSTWYYFSRQLVWVALGMAVLFVAARVDYHRWAAMAAPMLVVAIAMLVAVLIPGVGVTVNGSTRWLGAGPIQVQPSEFAKLAVLLFVANLLARRAKHIRDPRVTLRPVLLVSGLVAGLFMMQPNLGTTMVLAAIVISVLFVAGSPLPSLAGWGVIGAGAAAWLALSASYRRDRVLAFLDPWDDPLNTGWQTIQSAVGIVDGGLTGTGLGASRAKWGFLPFAHTDFIYAIIGEELGLIGTLVVLALFTAVCVLGIRTALCAPDRLGMLLAAGVTTWITVQAFVNIGAVIGILPITGVPLPFVSFGGSSLLASMFAAGMLLNVAAQGRPRARSDE